MAMARPKKGEELGESTQIGVRVPVAFRARLDALAEQHGRSITEEVRHALEVYVNAATVRPAKGKGARV